MSDCFDHAVDAFESQVHDSLYGDGRGESCSPFRTNNPLYYHAQCNNISIEATTDKAHLIRFNDGKKCWVAKKLCKKLTKNSVYIWKGATLKPIKE